MSAHAFAAWCEQTATSVVIKESTWLFPAVLVVHLIGLAWIGATVLSIDLRLIGAGPRGRSARDLWRDLRPWRWGGLALTLASGWLLFASEALRCFDNPLFRAKLVFLAAALLVAGTVRRRVLLSTDATRARERAVGLTSLALWFGAALMGRGVGFW